jgi:DeoR/GlpR family transcriptional regulator of sugar metabolism
MIERARRVTLLADQSKLGFRAPAVVAPTSLVSTLITDESAPEEMLAQLRACGMETVRLERDKVKKGIHSVEEEVAV